MPFDWFKDNAAALKKRALDEVAKYKNADFMQAVIAAVAKMAYADGIVDAKEKQKMIQYFQISEELKVFKQDEVIAAWTSFSGKYDFDLDIGSIESLKAIAKVRSKPDMARAVVRVSLIIANADGNFDDNEKKAAREICAELALDPTEFGL